MRARRVWKLSFASAAGLLATVAALFPADALAWGPLAHLQFGRSALDQLWSVSPVMRGLLSTYASEFLYGSLAADIIVGKNLAQYATHCHNWMIGFSVLDRARSDAQRAFSYGFLSHLSVDTIAHNYYVPYKTVQGFGARATGHAYWELRYDQRLDPELWKLARHVSQARYREHDEHLAECLADSYVIPFSISKQMFGSLLLAARLKKWQKLSEVIAGERDQTLYDEEVRECHKLAVGQILSMLKDGREAECTRADPTGGRNLHMANQLRVQLKTRGDLSERDRNTAVREARPAFKRAIYGRLTLPALPG